MSEDDDVSFGEFDDPVLGLIRYSITRSIHVICPHCGNPDCVEVEEFKERLKAAIWKGEPK